MMVVAAVVRARAVSSRRLAILEGGGHLDRVSVRVVQHPLASA